MMYDYALTFLILSILEVILGLDNLIFISLLAERLPIEFRDKARLWGLSAALLMRFLILFAVSWILSLKKPLFSLFHVQFSVHDLIMLLGGIFLIYKSAIEILHHVLSTQAKNQNNTNLKSQFLTAMTQIAAIDIVFSIDSILTAIALTQDIVLISLAFTVTMISMLFLSKYIIVILSKHPRVKTIALVFVLAIGVVLICSGVHVEISKNYIYAAFIFSLFVEVLNIIHAKKKSKQK